MTIFWVYPDAPTENEIGKQAVCLLQIVSAVRTVWQRPQVQGWFVSTIAHIMPRCYLSQVWYGNVPEYKYRYDYNVLACGDCLRRWHTNYNTTHLLQWFAGPTFNKTC